MLARRWTGASRRSSTRTVTSAPAIVVEPKATPRGARVVRSRASSWMLSERHVRGGVSTRSSTATPPPSIVRRSIETSNRRREAGRPRRPGLWKRFGGAGAGVRGREPLCRAGQSEQGAAMEAAFEAVELGERAAVAVAHAETPDAELPGGEADVDRGERHRPPRGRLQLPDQQLAGVARDQDHRGAGEQRDGRHEEREGEPEAVTSHDPQNAKTAR